VSQVFRQDTALPGTRMYVEHALPSHIPTYAARRSAETPRRFPATQTATPTRSRARDSARFHTANPTYFLSPPWQEVHSSISPG